MNQTEPTIIELEALIYAAIDEVNQMLPRNRAIPKLPTASLDMSTGAIDSLTLINLVVTLETLCEKRFARPIDLGAESLLEQAENPLRDVRSLARHVAALCAERM